MNWSDLQFRVAGFSDIDSIVELWEQHNKSTEKDESSKSYLIREMTAEKDFPELGRSYVVSRNGDLIAWTRWRYFCHDDGVHENAIPQGWYLLGVNVSKHVRRFGLGTALTRLRLNQLSEQTKVVYYFTNQDNKVSIDFHEELGFQAFAENVWFPGKEKKYQYQLFNLENWIDGKASCLEKLAGKHQPNFKQMKTSLKNAKIESIDINNFCVSASGASYESAKLTLDAFYWRVSVKELTQSPVYRSTEGYNIYLKHERH